MIKDLTRPPRELLVVNLRCEFEKGYLNNGDNVYLKAKGHIIIEMLMCFYRSRRWPISRISISRLNCLKLSNSGHRLFDNSANDQTDSVYKREFNYYFMRYFYYI